MRRFLPLLCILSVLLLGWMMPIRTSAAPVSAAPARSSAIELLEAVNALRTSHGFYPYAVNSILMSIAQAQAEYNLALGAITHTGPDGTRPYQRALNAGYLVAGDLSRGGFFSENITAGVGQTAEEAVQVWMGDAPHQNTMLSATLRDAGAGVAVSGNTYYYVLDAGLSTGGTPVAYTPAQPAKTSASVIIPSTPNANGSIIHVVQIGDTLGALSLAYGVKLADIYKLNNLTEKSVIYEGQKIVISQGFTPTPTQPTGTPTTRPTSTLWPTSTSTPRDTQAVLTATHTTTTGMPAGTASGMVTVIIAAAVVIAGGITLAGSRKKK